MNNEENTHFSLVNKNNIYCEMQHLNKKSLIINNSDRQMRLFFFHVHLPGGTVAM